MVYVKEQSPDVDKWRLAILGSFGGKVNVQCMVHQFPLIPAKGKEEKKKGCSKCHRKELFICHDINYLL